MGRGEEAVRLTGDKNASDSVKTAWGVVKEKIEELEGLSKVELFMQYANRIPQEYRNITDANTAKATLSRLLDEEKQNIEMLRKKAVDSSFMDQSIKNLSNEDDKMECPVCMEEFGSEDCEPAMMHACAHFMCIACAHLTMTAGNRQCAVCRQPIQGGLGVGYSAVQPPEQEVEVEDFGGDAFKAYGTKIAKMVVTLQKIMAEDPTDKVIVFVQWEKLKTKIARAFEEFNIPTVVINSQMPDYERCIRQRQFQTGEYPQNDTSSSGEGSDDEGAAPAAPFVEPRVMLLSLEQSASGANLTAANHVFLVHPMVAHEQQTAIAHEKQALGRVLRHGQEKMVSFVMVQFNRVIAAQRLGRRQ